MSKPDLWAEFICTKGFYSKSTIKRFSLNAELYNLTLSSADMKITTFHFHIPLQFVKCGFAGSNFPEHIFPALVGRPIIRSSTKVGNIEIKVRLMPVKHMHMGLSLSLVDKVGKEKHENSIRWIINECSSSIILQKKH